MRASLSHFTHLQSKAAARIDVCVCAPPHARARVCVCVCGCVCPRERLLLEQHARACARAFVHAVRAVAHERYGRALSHPRRRRAAAAACCAYLQPLLPRPVSRPPRVCVEGHVVVRATRTQPEHSTPHVRAPPPPPVLSVPNAGQSQRRGTPPLLTRALISRASEQPSPPPPLRRRRAASARCVQTCSPSHTTPPPPPLSSPALRGSGTARNGLDPKTINPIHRFTHLKHSNLNHTTAGRGGWAAARGAA